MEVADGLNDLVIRQPGTGAELAWVSQLVGKQGRLSERGRIGDATGRGSGSVESATA